MTTFKTQATVGLLLRGMVRRKIEAYCFMNDIGIDIYEDRGFLGSEFHFKFSGSEEAILGLKHFLRALVEAAKA